MSKPSKHILNQINLVPITNNWRGELRELCEKAGLIDNDLPPSPIAETPPKSPSGRKSVYSGEFCLFCENFCMQAKKELCL